MTCWTLFISWLGRVIYLMYGYIQRECYIGLNFWLLVALNDWTRKQSGFKTHAHAVIILKAFWCSIVVCRLSNQDVIESIINVSYTPQEYFDIIYFWHVFFLKLKCNSLHFHGKIIHEVSYNSIHLEILLPGNIYQLSS